MSKIFSISPNKDEDKIYQAIILLKLAISLLKQLFELKKV